MIRILINGCNGRMGQALAQAAAGEPSEFSVVAGVDRFPEGAQASFPVYSGLAKCREAADVLVDFSRPEALADVLAFALDRRCAVVLCTTGFTAEDVAAIERAAGQIAIFRSANMSLGVNLAVELCRKAAAFMGDNCDVEIIEKHHAGKVDAPSGTALMMADAINEVYLNSKTYTLGRASANQKRSRGEIGIHAIRGGTIVGEHEALFITPDEIVTIGHHAQSRQVFAAGALRAAAYLNGRAPGLYSMHDMLTEVTAVTAISTDERQAMVSVTHVAAPDVRRLFAALWTAGVNVDMIAQTAAAGDGTRPGPKLDVAFTLPRASLGEALPVVRACLTDGAAVHAREDIVKLSIEGPGMERQPGVAGRFYGALSEAGVEALAVTTSETKVSCCVPENGRRAAVEALMKEFKL